MAGQWGWNRAGDQHGQLVLPVRLPRVRLVTLPVALLVALLAMAAGPSAAAAGGAVVDTARLGNSKAYASPLAAVLSAAHAHHQQSQSHDLEVVGAVLRTALGGYQYSAGFAAPGQDRVRFRARVRRGETLVAWWHTHGSAGIGRDLFSPADVQLVRSTGKPLYLVTPAGAIKVLRPERLPAKPRSQLTRRSALRLPAGAAVGEWVQSIAARPEPPVTAPLVLAKTDS